MGSEDTNPYRTCFLIKGDYSDYEVFNKRSNAYHYADESGITDSYDEKCPLQTYVYKKVLTFFNRK